MMNHPQSQFTINEPLHNPDINYSFPFTRNEYLKLTYDFIYSEK